MAAGERVYRRWGRLAVFLTPTWVSGALRMPRRTFLVWNALAALVSTCIAELGAYGIGTALIGQLSARRGTVALAVAALALIAVAVAVACRRAQAERPQRPARSGPKPSTNDPSAASSDQLDAHPSKTLRGHD
jgi:membrane protein DedA with SNARE-associated domain